MIDTSIDINASEEFLKYKETLPKEPSDPNAKKEYYVGCYSADDWKYIHEILIQDGTLEDNIPSCSCTCINDCIHSPVRGIYLLNDSEANQLKNHSRVKYVHINDAKYPGTYLIDPNLLSENVQRYSEPVTNARTFSRITPSVPGQDLENRCTFQLLRHTQLEDPWIGNSSTLIYDRVSQYGTGEDVDVIVADRDMWFGHIEFQNNLGGPQNYIRRNVLPGNGTCDLLDLVLDAPYYLDPDFFNADPANRLMTRWDGTIVPVESYARDWWRINNLSNRSSKFVSPENGGTAVGNDNFGAIGISSFYTRDRCNGSNTLLNTGNGTHGTLCASVAYGRQYGWAYNANKWFLNLYGSGNNGFVSGFDLQKVFHQVKPINPKYGTKDPTISSNSWGVRFQIANNTSVYYYYRTGTDGSGGIATTFSPTTQGQPGFISNFEQSAIRHEFVPTSSYITAGDELIESGVIFVCSAGNTNQKLVKSDHPDYNNYISTTDNTPLELSLDGGGPIQAYRTINRQGFPGQIGKIGSGSNVEYRTIAVGSLDSVYLNSFDTPDTSGGSANAGKEKKARYTNCGNLIDCFAAGTTLAATNSLFQRFTRYDSVYTINGQQSLESYDGIFNGTSCACPVACGLIATKLQYNRNWTYADVKNWISGLGLVSSNNLYYGWGDLDDANSPNWIDQYNLHGSSGHVIWDKPTGNEPTLTSIDYVVTPNNSSIQIDNRTFQGSEVGIEYYNRTYSTNITIGKRDFTWTVKTKSAGTSQNLTFTNANKVNYSTEIISDTYTVQGLTDSFDYTADITSNEGLLSVNYREFVTSSVVKNGDILRLKLTSSSLNATQKDATLRVALSSDSNLASISTTWSVTTVDNIPSNLSFTNVPSAELNSQVLSDIITIAGLSDEINFNVSITSTDGLLSVNSGPFVKSATIRNGNQLQLRADTSPVWLEEKNVVVQLENTSTTWNVKNRNIIANSDPNAGSLIYALPFNTLNQVQDMSPEVRLKSSLSGGLRASSLITSVGGRSQPAITTDQSKYYGNTGSLKLAKGTTTTTFETTLVRIDTDSTQSLGFSDFTVELWMRFSGFNFGGEAGMSIFYPAYIDSRNINDYFFQLFIKGDNWVNTPGFRRGLLLGYPDANGVVQTICETSFQVLAQNSWNHIALTRSGSTFRIWVNGSNVTSGTRSMDLTSTGYNFAIPNFQRLTPDDVHIQDLRLYKGIVKYTSSFNPNTTVGSIMEPYTP